MQVKLNTNILQGLFSGTYGTNWEPAEYDDNGDELAIDYTHGDLMRSIVETYRGNEKYILEEMGVNFVTQIHFLKSWHSPREYNFKNDELDLVLTIDKRRMLKKLEELADNREFEDWLHENYSSYDGFWSFTPDNYRELAEQIKTQGDEFEQSMGALVRWCMQEYKKYTGRNINIEEDMVEDWNSNGYNGLDFTIEKSE